MPSLNVRRRSLPVALLSVAVVAFAAFLWNRPGIVLVGNEHYHPALDKAAHGWLDENTAILVPDNGDPAVLYDRLTKKTRPAPKVIEAGQRGEKEIFVSPRYIAIGRGGGYTPFNVINIYDRSLQLVRAIRGQIYMFGWLSGTDYFLGYENNKAALFHAKDKSLDETAPTGILFSNPQEVVLRDDHTITIDNYFGTPPMQTEWAVRVQPLSLPRMANKSWKRSYDDAFSPNFEATLRVQTDVPVRTLWNRAQRFLGLKPVVGRVNQLEIMSRDGKIKRILANLPKTRSYWAFRWDPGGKLIEVIDYYGSDDRIYVVPLPPNIIDDFERLAQPRNASARSIQKQQ